MHPCISSAAADYLLQHLTSLRSVQLDVLESDTRPWKPAADLGSMDGSMKLTSTVPVDCSGFSSAAKLKQLTLEAHTHRGALVNLAALSSLTSLQALTIHPRRLYARSQEVISASWASLQLLRMLHAPQLVCPAEAWCALASLPLLKDFRVGRLDIDATAPAAAALKEVHVARCLQLLHGPQQLPGCLVRQLPALQQLWAVAADHQQLAAGLAGHPQVQELYLDGGNTPWPVALASQLPALQRTTVRGASQSILADMAHAGQLQILSVHTVSVEQGLGDVLAALAGGPASGSLKELKVWTRAVGEEELVALLGTVSQQFPQLWQIAPEVFLPKQHLLVEDYVTDASRCQAAQKYLQAGLQASAAGQAWSVEVVSVWPLPHDESGCRRFAVRCLRRSG